MFGHHFISYSRIDAKHFATRLHDALLAEPLSFRAWLDVLELKAVIALGSIMSVLRAVSASPNGDNHNDEGRTLALLTKTRKARVVDLECESQLGAGRTSDL